MPDTSTQTQPDQTERVASSAIRTPDQRLRVFVSSTLQELADERRAAREAIESLRLTPVMFELGARPHPPRDLYRAYLQQSQVFVGLYWERYGWVAPGERLSGLEDEYELSGHLPKLIYVKKAASKREARLGALLERVRSDDQASYKAFETSAELHKLLADDLALLLTERFNQSQPPVTPVQDKRDLLTHDVLSQDLLGAVPVPLTKLIGRESELGAVDGLLGRDDVRIVTLTGAGGIGKSRLALALGAAWRDRLRDGVRFVPLADVSDPALVLVAISRTLGLRDGGGPEFLPTVQHALAGRQLLLVLDNFEQVLDAVPTLTALLLGAPGVKVLVTSRTVLRISGEHSLEVGPLALPDARHLPNVEALRVLGSVRLFVERARSVKPDFELTADNAESIARICLALDGVPLAIELAAARLRLLTPAVILARLDQRLPLLTGGARDLPARQRTLRDTIDWSVRLLPEAEQHLFAQLGVFPRSFTLEAAEAVCGDSAPDVLGSLTALVDGSLVQQDTREDEPCFSWLATVREYALEMLTLSGERDAAQRRHAAYYMALSAEAAVGLRGAQQGVWLNRLEFAYDNLRSTVRFELQQRDFAAAAEFAWNLYVLWWVGGHLGEVRGWMEEALDANQPLPPLARARALYYAYTVSFWQQIEQVNARVVPGLEESVALFHAQGALDGAGFASLSLGLALVASQSPDIAGANAAFEQSLRDFHAANHAWGEGIALLPLGRLSLLRGDVLEAERHFQNSLRLTRDAQNELGVSIALSHLGWTAVLRGDAAGAGGFFRDSLLRSVHLSHDEGIAYGLEGLLAVAALRDDANRAARLLGAVEARREQLGLHNIVNAGFYEPALSALRSRSEAVSALRSRSDAVSFASEEAAGRALSPSEAVAYALTEPRAVTGGHDEAQHD